MEKAKAKEAARILEKIENIDRLLNEIQLHSSVNGGIIFCGALLDVVEFDPSILGIEEFTNFVVERKKKLEKQMEEEF